MIIQKYALEASSRPFFIYKESSVKRNLRKFTSQLILKCFDSFLFHIQHNQLILKILFCNRGCALFFIDKK